ncbi:hypothetical protein AQJ23_30770 [Streptomyces antibioticus]|nr:cupin domain-containing protein [Streptomyces antibioticus]KUN21313.1 hypothetical protein AQJ23_30770 [Streptomyces antibioticus]
MTHSPVTAQGPWEELGAPLCLDTPWVKAWVEQVPPGGTRPLHTHRKPWATVVLSGAKVRSLGPEGEVLREGELPDGVVLFNPADEPLCHQMHNIGDTELIMVGLQWESGPASPAQPEAS